MIRHGVRDGEVVVGLSRIELCQRLGFEPVGPKVSVPEELAGLVSVLGQSWQKQLLQILGYDKKEPKCFLPDVVEEALEYLPELMQEVLYLRFGIFDGRACSLAETARKLKLHQGQVLVLEELAIAKLQETLFQISASNNGHEPTETELTLMAACV